MCGNEIKPQTLASPGVYLSIAMYPAICRYDDQAFDDMSEEHLKIYTYIYIYISLRNHCGLFQIKD